MPQNYIVKTLLSKDSLNKKVFKFGFKKAWITTYARDFSNQDDWGKISESTYNSNQAHIIYINTKKNGWKP